ncbi:MAG: hypothetical protein QNK37_05135 [Acidobacteriota bacterium]|nr:hypothetical protein [Acidobacteriota bacterium]
MAFEKAGRQISVFVDGHGSPGDMSIGAGTTSGNDAAGNTATTLTSNNAAWFHEQIKDKVTRITLFGCSVRAGDTRQSFLDAMGSDELEVRAYDQFVCTDSDLQTHYLSRGSTLKCSDQ